MEFEIAGLRRLNPDSLQCQSDNQRLISIPIGHPRKGGAGGREKISKQPYTKYYFGSEILGFPCRTGPRTMVQQNAPRRSRAISRRRWRRATKSDDDFLGLLLAMSDVPPDQPIQLNQDDSPCMNPADLAKSQCFTAALKPRSPGNPNSVYARRRRFPFWRMALDKVDTVQGVIVLASVDVGFQIYCRRTTLDGVDGV